jgi:hypothetical protein
LLTLPILIFLGLSLVVHFLAFRETNIQLCPSFAPMKIQWHKGVAFPLHSPNEFVQLIPIE